MSNPLTQPIDDSPTGILTTGNSKDTSQSDQPLQPPRFDDDIAKRAMLLAGAGVVGGLMAVFGWSSAVVFGVRLLAKHLEKPPR